MKIGLRILENDAVINRHILNALKKGLDSAIKRSIGTVSTQIKSTVKEAITSSPEYRELIGGELQAELGVPESSARLEQILDIWLASLNVSRKPVRISGSSLTGGFALFMIREDWADVLGTSAAQYTTLKGKVIPWLEWLLLAGDQTIITDYTFSASVPPGFYSRTGRGVMLEAPQRRWHVPRRYSGTALDNFVTRALFGVGEKIQQVMQKEVQKRFN